MANWAVSATPLETIPDVALQLCERKPTTAVGVTLIRRLRIGTTPLTDTDKLANHICRLLDTYATGHPNLTKEEAIKAP